MHCSVRTCFRASVALIFLWLFTILQIPEENEDVKNVVTILWETGSAWRED
jgi:hypothetical protein